MTSWGNPEVEALKQYCHENMNCHGRISWKNMTEEMRKNLFSGRSLSAVKQKWGALKKEERTDIKKKQVGENDEKTSKLIKKQKVEFKNKTQEDGVEPPVIYSISSNETETKSVLKVDVRNIGPAVYNYSYLLNKALTHWDVFDQRRNVLISSDSKYSYEFHVRTDTLEDIVYDITEVIEHRNQDVHKIPLEITSITLPQLKHITGNYELVKDPTNQNQPALINGNIVEENPFRAQAHEPKSVIYLSFFTFKDSGMSQEYCYLLLYHDENNIKVEQEE